MEQRVSLITLGVADIERARAFYKALGWTVAAEPGEDISFFQAGGLVFALWSRDELTADSGGQDSGGYGGVVLSHNVRSEEEVDAVLAEAQAAGAVISKPASKTFWGGYSGAFLDPDGHPWEIAHNPFWTINPDGSISLES